MTDAGSLPKIWLDTNTVLPNKEGVFIGFFRRRWLFLMMSKGGPVRDYPSLEHALLVERAIEADKTKAYQRMPRDARYNFKIGKLRERPDWEQIRLQTLWVLLQEKFGMVINTVPTPAQREIQIELINSAPAYLEDGGTSCDDNYFGCCLCPNCNRKKGQNIHGRLLMKLRDQLMQ